MEHRQWIWGLNFIFENQKALSSWLIPRVPALALGGSPGLGDWLGPLCRVWRRRGWAHSLPGSALAGSRSPELGVNPGSPVCKERADTAALTSLLTNIPHARAWNCWNSILCCFFFLQNTTCGCFLLSLIRWVTIFCSSFQAVDRAENHCSWRLIFDLHVYRKRWKWKRLSLLTATCLKAKDFVYFLEKFVNALYLLLTM